MKTDKALMTINGLSCKLNMPQAVKVRKDNEGNEIPVTLPPYHEIEAHKVDKYPACPSHWMHGSDISGSYFLGIKPDYGMWLDFNDCNKHIYHVAVVISIQGINPISGQKTDKLRLEQYKKKCPVHDIEFKQDRFCEKCEYSWPAQNYLSTTATPSGELWLDGFRTEDGKVRQYIFTEEEAKGVAKQLIGKDRVFAIGIAFYLSKDKKPIEPTIEIKTMGHPSWPHYPYKPIVIPDKETKTSSGIWCDTKKGMSSGISDQSLYSSDNIPVTYSSTGSEKLYMAIDEIDVKNVEVGHGNLIRQSVHIDPNKINFWRDEPEGFIYINYCSVDDVKKIIEAGKRVSKKDGFLHNVEKAI